MRMLLIVVLLFLPGCETLENKNAFAVCSAADTATTYHALTHGGRELNPLVKPIAKLGAGHFLVIGLAAGLLVYLIWDNLPKPVQATATAVECGAFTHNVFTM